MVIGLRTGHPNLDELSKTQELGAGWARLYLDWSKIELSQGTFEQHLLEDFDHRINGYRARGVKVLITVFGAPPWAAKDPSLRHRAAAGQPGDVRRVRAQPQRAVEGGTSRPTRSRTSRTWRSGGRLRRTPPSTWRC